MTRKGKTKKLHTFINFLVHKECIKIAKHKELNAPLWAQINFALNKKFDKLYKEDKKFYNFLKKNNNTRFKDIPIMFKEKETKNLNVVMSTKVYNRLRRYAKSEHTKLKDITEKIIKERLDKEDETKIQRDK